MTIENEEDKKESNWMEYLMKYGAMILALAIILVGFLIVFNPESIVPPSCKADSRFIEFYGAKCPYCQNMIPLVSQVENDTGITFEKLEIGSNLTNQKLMLSLNESILRDCPGELGVPTFFSLKTNRSICGAISRESLTKFIIENC